MPENKNEFIDADISNLLSTSYREVDIDDDFRMKLQARTRNAIATPGSYKQLVKWVTVLGFSAALTVVIMLVLLHMHSAPTMPQTRQIATIKKNGSVDINHSRILASESRVSAPKTDHQSCLVNHSTVSPQVNENETNIATENPKPVPAVHYGDPVAVVVATTSTSTRNVGYRVRSGEPVITDQNSMLTLVTPKGSELILDGRSELVLNSDGNAVLKSGRLLCRNREHEIRVINTPGGNIQLLGTVLNAAIKDKDSVAVTVVDGKVRLSNAYGNMILESGKRSLFVANRTPENGTPVNAVLETAWYDGRGKVVSDFGQIAYTVYRPGSHIGEIWTMNSDGTDRRRIKSFIGCADQGDWLAAAQWLTVDTGIMSWGTLDIANHKLDWQSGHPMAGLDTHFYLLNAVNCVDMPITLPSGYMFPIKVASPNGRYIAFAGFYNFPENGISQGGLWLYDMETGNIRKVEGCVQAPAWSPNSRFMVVSHGVNNGNEDILSLVDAKTGDITELNAKGRDATISPDGKWISFCGDFKHTEYWESTIFVKKIGVSSTARRITPEGQGAREPSWSPDGSRILYVTHELPDYMHVYVVHVDGSALKEIYNCNGNVIASWSADGRSVYIRDLKTHHVLQVIADGSGKVTDLGGNVEDSPLSLDEAVQTSHASADIEEATYQFALGMVTMVQAKPAESRAAFRASADIFASLPWKYPLAGLSVDNCMQYADAAKASADKSDEAILADSCMWRMKFCGYGLELYNRDKKALPPGLNTLEDWMLNYPSMIPNDWVTGIDRVEWTKMLFLCPGLKDSGPVPFIYRKSAAIGEAILTCPNHPQNSVKLEGWMLGKH